jgi:hypothetical protein
MRFTMAAFRTQAGAGGAPRKGAAHATSTLPALALSAALTHSAPFSSVHQRILPAYAKHFPAPAPPAATRHGKGIVLQFVAEPSLNNLAQAAGHKRDHLDAVSGDHLVQRPGNRTTNQRTDAQFREAKSFLNWYVIRKKLLCLVDSAPILGFNNVNVPRHIKNRCNSIVPGRKSRFHHWCPIGSPWKGIAFAVPELVQTAEWR